MNMFYVRKYNDRIVNELCQLGSVWEINKLLIIRSELPPEDVSKMLLIELYYEYDGYMYCYRPSEKHKNYIEFEKKFMIWESNSRC